MEEKSDDSILLLLVIRIMDALGNYGNKYTFLSPPLFYFFFMIDIFLYFLVPQAVQNMKSGQIIGKPGSWNLLL